MIRQLKRLSNASPWVQVAAFVIMLGLIFGGLDWAGITPLAAILIVLTAVICLAVLGVVYLFAMSRIGVDTDQSH